MDPNTMTVTELLETMETQVDMLRDLRDTAKEQRLWRLYDWQAERLVSTLKNVKLFLSEQEEAQ